MRPNYSERKCGGVSDFSSYTGRVKPLLDQAFKRELLRIVGDIGLRNIHPFMSSIGSGKKIRGALCCMICESLGGQLQAAISRAVAIELIQAATLIHDDFVDQDVVRRSRPAIWTLEGSRRAVLIGDVIFSSAITMMNDLSRVDGLAISHAISEVSNGALHEPLDPRSVAMEIEFDGLHRNTYERIISLKTAVLFGTACCLGALAAQKNGKLRKIFYQYGLRIGEAYQIADDVEEVKAYLLKQTISPNQLVSLAPAFLRFDGGISRQNITDLLKGSGRRLTKGESDSFSVTASLMEKEIEERIGSAALAIQRVFPNNDMLHVLRSAPKEIIRMFNHQH